MQILTSSSNCSCAEVPTITALITVAKYNGIFQKKLAYPSLVSNSPKTPSCTAKCIIVSDKTLSVISEVNSYLNILLTSIVTYQFHDSLLSRFIIMY